MGLGCRSGTSERGQEPGGWLRRSWPGCQRTAGQSCGKELYVGREQPSPGPQLVVIG